MILWSLKDTFSTTDYIVLNGKKNMKNALEMKWLCLFGDTSLEITWRN
jgi:hypothetical protein